MCTTISFVDISAENEYTINSQSNTEEVFLEDRKTEDSLENTLNCVPKVQGGSRISQANGQGCEFACSNLYVLSEAVHGGLLFLFFQKEGLL